MSTLNTENQTGAAPDYISSIANVLTSPSALQRKSIEHVEGLLNGSVKLVDATNPFVTLMGVSAGNVAALALSQIKDLRVRFPVMATELSELYPHMSEDEYLGRFAMPHHQKVTLIIPIAEIKARYIRAADGSASVTVPRYSNVTVDGYTFTLMYPVTITERAHGGWSVRYDLSEQADIQPMTSSIVYHREMRTRVDDGSILHIELDMVQLRLTTTDMDLNPTKGLNKIITHPDHYCYLKAWSKGRNDANWRPLKITHSDTFYDASTPTLVVDVVEGGVNVRLPQIYTNNGTVTGRIRIDIFSTKGEMFLNTLGKTMTDFNSDFPNDSMRPVTSQHAAFGAITNKLMFFNASVAGGKNPLTFEELKTRVIENTLGPAEKPITPAQLTRSIEHDGFVMRQHVNNVTATHLLASRALPTSSDRLLVTPASASIESVVTTVDELRSNPWVTSTGDRTTITNAAIWINDNGKIRLCSVDELAAITSGTAEETVAMVNSGKYLYTPYYYVLDTTGDTFNVRPYYLDGCKAVVDRFVDENKATQLQVEINSIDITNSSTGWEVVIAVTSNPAWKALPASQRHAQLSFVTPGLGGRSAINAELLGTDDQGEDIYSFRIDSVYDIDDNHKVGLINFNSVFGGSEPSFSDLVQKMRVTFASSAIMPSGTQATALDNELVMVDLPPRIRAVSAHEVILTFGVYLRNLWASCRTLQTSQVWRTYQADVPDILLEDEYEINPDTRTILFYNPDGSTYTKIKQRAGDVRMEDGEIVYLHRKGQPILNGGEAIVADTGSYLRQFSVLFFEGCYRFATDMSTSQYMDEMAAVTTSYITDKLGAYNDKSQERTVVYFYPKVSMGLLDAVIDEGIVTKIDADQSLTVRLGVHKRVYENTNLRKDLERKTIEVIYNFLDRDVVSVSDMTDELRAIYGDDVVSVSVSGLGGGADVVSILNTNERLSLRKWLTLLDSGELTVREAITVDFFNHTKEKTQ